MATDDDKLRDFDPFEVIDQLGFPGKPTEFDKLVQENARMKQALRDFHAWLDTAPWIALKEAWPSAVRAKLLELGLD